MTLFTDIFIEVTKAQSNEIWEYRAKQLSVYLHTKHAEATNTPMSVLKHMNLVLFPVLNLPLTISVFRGTDLH